MAFSQADVDGLKAAMAAAGNAQDVSYSDGARVRYMTPAEAGQLLELMMADVRSSAAAAATLAGQPSPTIRAFRGSMRSGY